MSEGSATAETQQPVQRFVLENGLLGSSDRNEGAVWRMCHMRISSFSVTSKEQQQQQQPTKPGGKSSDAEPETVRITVSMRKSNRRTLRTPPFEASVGGRVDITFSFRYAHTFRDSADVLVVRLQRATKKKRHNTIALAPVYLSDILQCPLDDDITLSQRREKAWVPYAKLHVLMGSYPEHVASLEDAQEWEFSLLPEGQNVASDDEAGLFEPPAAADSAMPDPSAAGVVGGALAVASAAEMRRSVPVQQSPMMVMIVPPPSPVAVASSAPTIAAHAPANKGKKPQKQQRAPPTPKPRTRGKPAIAIGHDDLISSSSSDTDDELPPSYSDALATQPLFDAAGSSALAALPMPSAGNSVTSGSLRDAPTTTATTTAAAAAAAQPAASSASSAIAAPAVAGSAAASGSESQAATTSIVPPSSTTATASAAATAAAAAAAAAQAEAVLTGLPIDFQDADLQRTADAYERTIRGATRLLLCDGQKRRSRKVVEIGERPRVRESGTCTVCTRTTRDVAALLKVLFERRGDEQTSVAIAGSDRFVNDVMRPFLELSNTKPLNSEPVKFFVLPLGKSSDVSMHVASLDAEYRALFADDTWIRAMDKREQLSPEEASTLEQRVLRYLDSAAAVCRFDVGEAMLTPTSGPARVMPFLKAVQIVSNVDADASIDYWTPPKKKADHDQHHQVKSPLQTLVITRLPGIAAKVLHLDTELFPTADTLSTVILLNKTGLKSAMKAFAGKISVMMHDKKDKDKSRDKDKSVSSPLTPSLAVAPTPATPSSTGPVAATATTTTATTAEGTAAKEAASVEVVDLSPREQRPSTPLGHTRSTEALRQPTAGKEKGDKDKDKGDKEKDKDKDKDKVEQVTASVTKLMCSAESHSSFRVLVDGVEFSGIKMVSIKPTWRATRPFFIHCFSLSRQQSPAIAPPSTTGSSSTSQ